MLGVSLLLPAILSLDSFSQEKINNSNIERELVEIKQQLQQVSDKINSAIQSNDTAKIKKDVMVIVNQQVAKIDAKLDKLEQDVTVVSAVEKNLKDNQEKLLDKNKTLTTSVNGVIAVVFLNLIVTIIVFFTHRPVKLQALLEAIEQLKIQTQTDREKMKEIEDILRKKDLL